MTNSIVRRIRQSQEDSLFARAAKLEMPQPGDQILVDRSEWYALPEGGLLRVCERAEREERERLISLVPRRQCSTFWGPSIGPPDGVKPEDMSTSGGPFTSRAFRDLVRGGLRRECQVVDRFWHWKRLPEADGGMDRYETVWRWRLPLLTCQHYRLMKSYGYAAGR